MSKPTYRTHGDPYSDPPRAKRCTICGALIGDEDQHTRWHSGEVSDYEPLSPCGHWSGAYHPNPPEEPGGVWGKTIRPAVCQLVEGHDGPHWAQGNPPMTWVDRWSHLSDSAEYKKHFEVT